MGDTRPKAKEPDLFVPLIPDAAQSVAVEGATVGVHVTIDQTDVVSATRIPRIACPKSIACAKGRPEGLKIIRITSCIAAVKIRDRYHPASNRLTIVLCAPPVHFAAGFLICPDTGNCYWCARGALTRPIRRRFRAGLVLA